MGFPIIIYRSLIKFIPDFHRKSYAVCRFFKTLNNEGDGHCNVNGVVVRPFSHARPHITDKYVQLLCAYGTLIAFRNPCAIYQLHPDNVIMVS